MMTLPSSRNSRMTRNRLSISLAESELVGSSNAIILALRASAGNLHHLPLTNGDISAASPGRYQTQMLQLQAGLIVEQRAIDDAASVRQLTEIDIFGDGHLRDQMQLW